MATIFVGAHPIGGYVNTIFDWTGHFFLLYSEDDTPSGDDLIIRGGQHNETIVLEANIAFSSSVDDPGYWGKEGGIIAPDDPNDYFGYAALDLSGRSASAVWNTLVSVADQIAAHHIDYDRPTQNSNSVAATLLATVGLEIVEPEIGGSYTYIYPGDGHILTSDYVYNEFYSYNILGNDLNVNGDPVDDTLTALQGGELFTNGPGDYLAGYAGDDNLMDGSRDDVLEGGEGNDFYYLTDDGEADTLIVGQDDDYIAGDFSADDRLVFRADLVEPTTGASGLPTGAETTGIPLLGGFIVNDESLPSHITRASFVSSVESGVSVRIFDWSTEEIVDGTIPSETGLDSWSAFAVYTSISDFDAENNPVTTYYNKRSFSIEYTWNHNYDTLKIDIAYIVDNSGGGGNEIWQGATVLLEDFDEGDFGIQFFDRSNGMVTDGDGVDYIHNDGSYVTLVALPPVPDNITVV